MAARSTTSPFTSTSARFSSKTRIRWPPVRRSRIRGISAGEAGMTLLELVIVMGLLSLVMGIFLPTMSAVQRGFERQTDRSQSNDQARLGVEELDREIRSGNVLYNPATCPNYPLTCNDPGNGIYPGMSLLIYSQTNAPSRNPGFQCVQWRIVGGRLQRRSWSITWRTDNNVSAWRIVADHIV